MCDNKVEYLIPRGYLFKEAAEYTCGMTGVYGETVLCPTCEKAAEEK